MPACIHITDGKLHDVNLLDIGVSDPGAFYIRDRAGPDLARLHTLHLHGAHFLLRAEKNARLRCLYSREVDRTTGVIRDPIILPDPEKTAKACPDKLRRSQYVHRARDKTRGFRTRDFVLPPLTIAELYPARWPVERSFKWIQQPPRIRSLFGTSDNAVKTRIRIATSVRVRVAIIRSRPGRKESLHTILPIWSRTPVESIPSNQRLTMTARKNDIPPTYQQLNPLDETLGHWYPLNVSLRASLLRSFPARPCQSV